MNFRFVSDFEFRASDLPTTLLPLYRLFSLFSFLISIFSLCPSADSFLFSLFTITQFLNYSTSIFILFSFLLPISNLQTANFYRGGVPRKATSRGNVASHVKTLAGSRGKQNPALHIYALQCLRQHWWMTSSKDFTELLAPMVQ